MQHLPLLTHLFWQPASSVDKIFSQGGLYDRMTVDGMR